MRKSAALLLVLVFLTASFVYVTRPVVAVSEDSWVSKAQMPTARAYLRVATVNETIYALGNGLNEAYNPATDNWTTKASMPDSQSLFAIAACQGKIYCIGGQPTGFTGASDVNRVYDPETDSWQTKASMPTARYGSQAEVVDDKIYLIGGRRSIGYNLGTEGLYVTEVYNPASDTWSTGSPMLNSEDCVAAMVDSKIYLIGETTQIYNPKTDTWSVGAPPPEKIIYADSAAAAATTGTMAPKRIYVYNGASLQIYDPKADSWTNGTAPSTSRQALAIGTVDDKLYFIGGMSYPISGFGLYYVFHATNEQYTPVGYGTLPEPFPTVLVATASGLSVAVVAVGLLVYFKKRKH